ncbi:hypothetical protein [Hymenobacter negativus]|uniref:Uncharacterized protein n=1 Tax=Hymenobacter negativus TaxID=2795026 RepID=A0ABS3QDW6_9BACT|nr:hypothetical protein [Hymenobacter negativus]MBO2009188.1 hypothetical protein [Hymenobacter negativus]
MDDYSIYLEELAATIEITGPVWGMYSLKHGTSRGAIIEQLASEFRQIRERFGVLPAENDFIRLSNEKKRFKVTYREFMHRNDMRVVRFIVEMH